MVSPEIIPHKPNHGAPGELEERWTKQNHSHSEFLEWNINLLKKRGCGEWDIANKISSQQEIPTSFPVKSSSKSTFPCFKPIRRSPMVGEWRQGATVALKGFVCFGGANCWPLGRRIREGQGGGQKGEAQNPQDLPNKEMRRILETEKSCSYNFLQSGGFTGRF